MALDVLWDYYTIIDNTWNLSFDGNCESVKWDPGAVGVIRKLCWCDWGTVEIAMGAVKLDPGAVKCRAVKCRPY